MTQIKQLKDTTGNFYPVTHKDAIVGMEDIQVDMTGYATEQWVENKGYLTEHQDISGKVDVIDFEEATLVTSASLNKLHQNLLWNSEQVYVRCDKTKTQEEALVGDSSVVYFTDDTNEIIVNGQSYGKLGGGYLPLTGGTMSGDTKFNGASIYFNNDCAALKINDAGAFEIYSGNGITLSGSVECSDSITCASSINAQAFYETSDARKKDIKEDLSLDKCYDLIDKCQTVIYSLKDQTKEQVGMIAQEIEEFFPEVVATDEEGFKSLAYDRLVVICFKVLKDIIKRLNHIENIL